MNATGKVLRAVVLSAPLFGIGCRDSQGPADLPAMSGGRISPLCQLGCVDPDPFPEAPGIFVGNLLSDENCIGAGWSDYDLDGLADLCEEQLAWAFRPELSYFSEDYVDREPRWVAKPIGSDSVRIGYLFSYYRDMGDDVFGGSHWGDSERLWVDLWYNPSTKHWITGQLYAPAHDRMSVATGTPGWYPKRYLSAWSPPLNPSYFNVVYPGSRGGQVRVFVGEGKHSSYLSHEECNYGGGILHSDNCTHHDTVVRDGAGPIQNLGSRWHPFIKCVVTQNPYHPFYGAGGVECYWTAPKFMGWYPYANDPGSDGYGGHLEAFGF